MQRFRKRPVEIEAALLSTETTADIVDWIEENGGKVTVPRSGLYITTLEGVMHARNGDYVIRGVCGEFYPCKPGVFEATYEAVN